MVCTFWRTGRRSAGIYMGDRRCLGRRKKGEQSVGRRGGAGAPRRGRGRAGGGAREEKRGGLTGAHVSGDMLRTGEGGLADGTLDKGGWMVSSGDDEEEEERERTL